MPHTQAMKDTKERMKKSVEAFQQELGSIRTGRANAGILDTLDFDVYDSRMKLNQLGTVTVPDAHTIAIDLWDKSQIALVEKILRASALNINPVNDGRIIRIPIPPLTEERRRELVKLASQYAEEARVAVRNIRRQANDIIKQLQKDGDIPEDNAHRLSDDVQKWTDSHIGEIDEILKAKEADIMEV